MTSLFIFPNFRVPLPAAAGRALSSSAQHSTTSTAERPPAPHAFRMRHGAHATAYWNFAIY
eukprot:4824746-Pleurochrysis_carterae.AAC.1